MFHKRKVVLSLSLSLCACNQCNDILVTFTPSLGCCNLVSQHQLGILDIVELKHSLGDLLQLSL